ncbi:hypothetical protein ACQPZU_15115 [Saccharomonospora azurea]|nr:hypothetical protein [Saccharomonospora azurea]
MSESAKRHHRMLLSLLPALALTACGGGLPDAADGTDLSACSDGACEVRVTTGDTFDHPELGAVEVVVRDDTIEVSAGSRDGEGNGWNVSGAGTEGHSLNLNGQVFAVVAVDGDQGVLRVGE